MKQFDAPKVCFRVSKAASALKKIKSWQVAIDKKWHESAKIIEKTNSEPFYVASRLSPFMLRGLSVIRTIIIIYKCKELVEYSSKQRQSRLQMNLNSTNLINIIALSNNCKYVDQNCQWQYVGFSILIKALCTAINFTDSDWGCRPLWIGDLPGAKQLHTILTIYNISLWIPHSED